ncbi:6062_t:CDS:2, partial [Ambispora leptoticha]
MESNLSYSSTSEAEIKDISVKVNDNEPVAVSLNLSYKLREIREHLRYIHGIKMGTNACFVSEIGRIIPADESRKSLKDIVSENILRIKRIPDQIDWIEIIEKKHLEYGFFLGDEQKIKANSKVIQLVKYPEPDSKLDASNMHDVLFQCNNEISAKLFKNKIAKTVIFAPGMKLGIDFNMTKEINKKEQTSTTYRIKERVKAILDMNKLGVEATHDFKNEVNEALSGDDDQSKRDKLKKFEEKYGRYLSKKIKLGGKIIYVENEKSDLGESRNLNQISGELSFGKNISYTGTGVKYANYTATDSSQQSKANESCFEMFGGKDSTRENESEWLNSLDNFKNWEAIEYDDIVSIFDILDDPIRKTISALFGLTIVNTGVNSIKFNYDTRYNKPYIQKFTFHNNLRKHHKVFANVINHKDPGEIFALRLHYNEDNTTPQIVLHQVGKIKKPNSNSIKTIILELTWVIIDLSTDFLLSSAVTNLNIICNEAFAKINGDSFETEELNDNDANISHIMTCITRTKANEHYNLSKTNFVVASHFLCYNSNAKIKCHGICSSVDHKLKEQLDMQRLELKINYCAISDATGNNGQFGMSISEKKK